MEFFKAQRGDGDEKKNDGIMILSFNEPRKENFGCIFLIILSKLRLKDLIYFHNVKGNYNRFPSYYINSFQ